MKNFILYLYLAVITVLSGCQQTDTLEPDTTFKEKTVVFANLQDGKTFQGVTLTKTLPLNIAYDIKLAEIKDALIYMKINGMKIVPLIYEKDGVYKPLDYLTIHAGSNYELFVNIGEKRFYAQTYVPFIPKINQAQLVDGRYFTAKVNTRLNEVYGLAWVIPGAKEYTFLGAAQDFQEITNPENSNILSELTIRTIDIPLIYQSGNYLSAAVVKAFAFDKQFYNYFKTKSNNQQITNSFTQGGGQTMWNIVGNDVIGLFIGTAEGNSYKPN